MSWSRSKRSKSKSSRREGMWAPYVPVATRRASAATAMAARKKKGLPVDPVTEVPRKIATTVWGAAWVKGLESHADFDNRLPRGATYVRNGSVVHLAIERGKVSAIVSGSELYDVSITVKPLPKERWSKLVAKCAGNVRSSLDLLRGKLSPELLSTLTSTGEGMIPLRGDLGMKCSCPDGVGLCKHVAAAFYGVGARLDRSPELLFTLRGVSERDLISDAATAVGKRSSDKALKESDDSLGALFGIDLVDEPGAAKVTTSTTRAAAKSGAKASVKPSAKKAKVAAEPKESKASAKKASERAPKEKRAPARSAFADAVASVTSGIAAIVGRRR
jgi:uncharacterized Zn finger protein